MSIANSDEIEHLKRKLEEITAERDSLLAENRRLIQATKDYVDLSQIPGLNPASYTTPSTNTIKKQSFSLIQNINSSVPEKIQLFRSLFRGREDVSSWTPSLGQNRGTVKVESCYG